MSELPEGWEVVPIGTIAEVVGGSTPKTSMPEYWDGDLAWITPNDLSGYKGKHIARGDRSITKAGYDSCSARMVPKGTVLFTSRAPIGYVAIASGPVCTNQGFKSFVPSERIGSDYLYWYLRYATPKIRNMGSGTTFSEISGKVAKTIPVVLAPADEQQLIVEAIEEQFSRLDAGVESLQRAKRNLTRFRASILKAAIEGRLVPRPVDMKFADTLLEKIGVQRRAHHEETNSKRKYKHPARAELDGDVPVGWALASLDQLAVVLTDGDHRPPPRTDSGIPHLSAKHVRHGRLSFEGVTFVSEKGFEQTRARYEPVPGDLIITCVGTVGETAVVPPGKVFSADRNLAGVRFSAVGPLPHFIEMVLNAPQWKRMLREASGSTAQPHLYLRDLRSVPIPLPPLAEQEMIVEEVDRQFSIIDSMAATIDAGLQRAGSLRQSILSQAFTGGLIASTTST